MGNASRPRILLFQVRHTPEEKQREFASFVRTSGFGADAIEAHDVLVAPPRIESLDGASAVVIGGSRASVFEDVPNQDALIAVVREARARRIPILGCCYGGQLVAHAFGGEVIRDNANEEYGSFLIRTSEDAWTDMLFADSPDEFYAQCAHQDRITRVPAGGLVLASSAKCTVQAFSIPGADIYGFQFHPERSKEEFAEILSRKLADHSAGDKRFEEALASLQDSREAEAMVRKFLERIVMHARA